MKTEFELKINGSGTKEELLEDLKEFIESIENTNEEDLKDYGDYERFYLLMSIEENCTDEL